MLPIYWLVPALAEHLELKFQKFGEVRKPDSEPHKYAESGRGVGIPDPRTEHCVIAQYSVLMSNVLPGAGEISRPQIAEFPAAHMLAHLACHAAGQVDLFALKP